MTVTTSPATAGSRRHPLTSSRTSRKSAAASAPERSTRAALIGRSGRSKPSVTGRRDGARRSAASAMSASGTCSAKIHSQPRTWVMMPPAAGPSAAPMTPALTQVRTASSSERSCAASSSSEAVTSAAPPIACTHRAARRTSNSGATAHAADAAANTTAPTAQTVAGRRRARSAAGTAASASTRL